MNKILLLLVLVILLAAGGYFLLVSNKNNKIDVKSDTINSNNSINNNNVSQSTAEKIIVNMTENGFSPSTINIKQGETVIFKNDDTRNRWPASAIHPIHSVYGGTSLKEHCPDTAGTAFDACKGILPADSWSFIFNKKGNWRYHDHLYPNFTGTINVQ